MKVYVLEQGWYSDRHVIGVVETKEEAEKISKTLDCDYAEFDTKAINTNRLRFIVADYWGEWEAEYAEDWRFPECTETTIIYSDCYCVFANSAEQAIKIAQDMKAQEKAREAGIV